MVKRNELNSVPDGGSAYLASICNDGCKPTRS